MKMLDVDYVLVIFGGVIGYSGDDINKFLWMVRIAEGEHPQEIKVLDHRCCILSVRFRMPDGSKILVQYDSLRTSLLKFIKIQRKSIFNECSEIR